MPAKVCGALRRHHHPRGHLFAPRREWSEARLPEHLCRPGRRQLEPYARPVQAGEEPAAGPVSGKSEHLAGPGAGQFEQYLIQNLLLGVVELDLDSACLPVQDDLLTACGRQLTADRPDKVDSRAQPAHVVRACVKVQHGAARCVQQDDFR